MRSCGVVKSGGVILVGRKRVGRFLSTLVYQHLMSSHENFSDLLVTHPGFVSI